MGSKERNSPAELACDALSRLSGLDVFDEKCAGHFALGQVADKWTLLLIYALAGGTRRYGQLQRQVRGISPKMLIQNLRKLETLGFLTRTVHPVVPPMVEYTLTPLGLSFVQPLAGICAWARANLPELQKVHARIKRTAKRQPPPPPPPRQAPVALRRLAGRS